jgi:hypothetical protein
VYRATTKRTSHPISDLHRLVHFLEFARNSHIILLFPCQVVFRKALPTGFVQLYLTLSRGLPLTSYPRH